MAIRFCFLVLFQAPSRDGGCRDGEASAHFFRKSCIAKCSDDSALVASASVHVCAPQPAQHQRCAFGAGLALLALLLRAASQRRAPRLRGARRSCMSSKASRPAPIDPVEVVTARPERGWGSKLIRLRSIACASRVRRCVGGWGGGQRTASEKQMHRRRESVPHVQEQHGCTPAVDDYEVLLHQEKQARSCHRNKHGQDEGSGCWTFNFDTHYSFCVLCVCVCGLEGAISERLFWVIKHSSPTYDTPAASPLAAS